MIYYNFKIDTNEGEPFYVNALTYYFAEMKCTTSGFTPVQETRIERENGRFDMFVDELLWLYDRAVRKLLSGTTSIFNDVLRKCGIYIEVPLDTARSEYLTLQSITEPNSKLYISEREGSFKERDIRYEVIKVPCFIIQAIKEGKLEKYPNIYHIRQTGQACGVSHIIRIIPDELQEEIKEFKDKPNLGYIAGKYGFPLVVDCNGNMRVADNNEIIDLDSYIFETSFNYH